MDNHHPHISQQKAKSKFNIVLFEPEMPANTGNIARTCTITDAALHLIKPLGFDISDKAVRRAGLDYWGELDLHVYENWQDFQDKNPDARVILATTKGSKPFNQLEYYEGDFFVFGKESAGLPDYVHEAHPDTRLRIPMGEKFRSLNLSNAVAIVLYEALRQNDYFDLV